MIKVGEAGPLQSRDDPVPRSNLDDPNLGRRAVPRFSLEGGSEYDWGSERILAPGMRWMPIGP